jgi:hypothetical protein
MVVAYLRGLLKPSLHYGLRSIVAENYVFEALLADNQAFMLESSIQSDASIIPALKIESKRETMRLINRRRQRCMEIRNGAIYGARKAKTPGEISLYQLYHLCSRAGILEALTGGNPTNNNG